MGPGSTGPTPGTASEADDFMSRVAAFDADELFRIHPELKRRLEGRAGTIAEQRAPQMAQQQMAAREAQIRAQAREEAMREAEDNRLRNLRESDPFQYAEISRQVEQERLGRQAQDAARRAQDAPIMAANHAIMAMDRQVLDAILGELPDKEREQLIAERSHVWSQSGDAYVARRTMLQDVMNRKTELARREWERSSAAQQQRNTVVAAAERSDLLAQENAGSTVDTGSGFASGGIPTPDQWAQMSRVQHEQMKRINPNILSQIEQAATQRGEGLSFDDMKRQAGRGG